MNDEQSAMRVIGPLIGAVLLFIVVYTAIQQFRSNANTFQVSSEVASADEESAPIVINVQGRRVEVEDEADAKPEPTIELEPTAEPEPTVKPEPTVEPEPTAGPEPTEPIDIAHVFSKGACAGCHIIPDVRGAVGAIGPDLTLIGADAGSRIEEYTAEEYLYEALVEPNAYIVPECPTGPCLEGVMLPTFVEALDEAEIDALVQYMLALGND